MGAMSAECKGPRGSAGGGASGGVKYRRRRDRRRSAVWGKGRHGGLLLRSLPWRGVFVLAGGWGEVVGYWAGAGASLRRVR